MLRLNLSGREYCEWCGLFQSGRSDRHKKFLEYLKKTKSMEKSKLDLEKANSEFKDEIEFSANHKLLGLYCADMRGAYKQLPVEKFAENCVGTWSCDQKKYRYFLVPYLTFGNVQSVYHFSACAELFTHILLSFGVIIDNFVDDLE